MNIDKDQGNMDREDDPRSANSFPQLVRAAAAAYGDDLAIRLSGDTIPDDSISFSELDRKSAELARGLIARGVGKGTRIGFIFGNGPAFALWLAAISRIGAVAIPISTMIKANELVRVLHQSDLTGLIVQRTLLGKDYVERLCQVLPELREGDDPDLRIARTPYLRWIVSTGDDLPPTIYDMSFFAGPARTVSADLLLAMEAEVHPTDQMIEIYTSGSMAFPKGVKHSHGAVLFRSHYLRTMLSLERGSQVTVPLPMFWVGGLMIFLLPQWEAGVATLCTEATSSGGSHMALGSVLAEEEIKLRQQQLKPYWALGMSETLGPYAHGDVVRVPGHPLCSPLDHIADRFEVRVADSEGNVVTEGETGEIQVRGFAVTAGLHKIERSECFTPDGYYRTGDMGIAEGSRIHFVGRSGDMIKTAGANVSPAEVELEMQQLDGVHSAYVVGLPDGQRGQLVVAAVVPRAGVTLDFEDIEVKLKQRLSSYKVPRAYLAIAREEVPMLPTNKVARREIVTLMQKRLGIGEEASCSN